MADGTSAGGTWLELAVSADPEAVEAVAEILSRAAPSGVSVEAPFATEQEGLAARPLAGAPAVVRAYVSALDRSGAERAVAEARERLGHLQAFGLRPIGDLEVRAVHEEDWASAWKDHFPVLRVGRRVIICPTWRDHVPAGDEVVIRIDPGMAFGTGLHPTTRLCLRLLERWADTGVLRWASVLDVGSGSGILSLAAGLLGAGPLRAVDTDPVAVEATALNARRNGLSIEVSRGSLPVADGPFDLVLANLVAGILVDLAEDLASSVRPGRAERVTEGSVSHHGDDEDPGRLLESGGRLLGSGGCLLASGIFMDREPEVRRAFAAAGLRVLAREQEEDWVALALERPSVAVSAER